MVYRRIEWFIYSFFIKLIVFIEIKNCLYLANIFSFYFDEKEREERIRKIMDEIEEYYNSIKFLQKHHDSIDIFNKKFKEFINENENRKELKQLKNSILRLEGAFFK